MLAWCLQDGRFKLGITGVYVLAGCLRIALRGKYSLGVSVGRGEKINNDYLDCDAGEGAKEEGVEVVLAVAMRVVRNNI